MYVGGTVLYFIPPFGLQYHLTGTVRTATSTAQVPIVGKSRPLAEKSTTVQYSTSTALYVLSLPVQSTGREYR